MSQVLLQIVSDGIDYFRTMSIKDLSLAAETYRRTHDWVDAGNVVWDKSMPAMISDTEEVQLTVIHDVDDPQSSEDCWDEVHDFLTEKNAL